VLWSDSAVQSGSAAALDSGVQLGLAVASDSAAASDSAGRLGWDRLALICSFLLFERKPDISIRNQCRTKSVTLLETRISKTILLVLTRLTVLSVNSEQVVIKESASVSEMMLVRTVLLLQLWKIVNADLAHRLAKGEHSREAVTRVDYALLRTDALRKQQRNENIRGEPKRSRAYDNRNYVPVHAL